MNERIRLLAERAETYADYYAMLSETGEKEIFIKKFAQLIVQECIDIISPYTVRMSRPGEEYLHPILEIKEHFGVEE
jgi:hypothetical protein